MSKIGQAAQKIEQEGAELGQTQQKPRLDYSMISKLATGFSGD